MRAYKFLDAEGRAPFTATPWPRTRGWRRRLLGRAARGARVSIRRRGVLVRRRDVGDRARRRDHRDPPQGGRRRAGVSFRRSPTTRKRSANWPSSGRGGAGTAPLTRCGPQVTASSPLVLLPWPRSRSSPPVAATWSTAIGRVRPLPLLPTLPTSRYTAIARSRRSWPPAQPATPPPDPTVGRTGSTAGTPLNAASSPPGSPSRLRLDESTAAPPDRDV